LLDPRVVVYALVHYLGTHPTIELPADLLRAAHGPIAEDEMQPKGDCDPPGQSRQHGLPHPRGTRLGGGSI